MKRFVFPLLLGAVALLAPGRSLAQDKPVLNTAPPGTAPVTPAPAPVYTPTPTPSPAPAAPTYTPPASNVDPQPSYNSPSGLELPGREQARKAAEQHADQYTKLFVYSGIGLGYSSYYGYSNFNFSISPALGYRVSDRFSIGPGISYAYNNVGTDNGYGKAEQHGANSVGIKVFGQLMVIDHFFIHAEYETTRAQFVTVDQYDRYAGTVSRQVQTPLLGVGYRSQISNRAAADIVLLYNFQDNYNSIYPNPVLRFNFLFNIGH